MNQEELEKAVAAAEEKKAAELAGRQKRQAKIEADTFPFVAGAGAFALGLALSAGQLPLLAGVAAGAAYGGARYVSKKIYDSKSIKGLFKSAAHAVTACALAAGITMATMGAYCAVNKAPPPDPLTRDANVEQCVKPDPCAWRANLAKIAGARSLRIR